jgi:hypothetical protein
MTNPQPQGVDAQAVIAKLLAEISRLQLENAVLRVSLDTAGHEDAE